MRDGLKIEQFKPWQGDSGLLGLIVTLDMRNEEISLNKKLSNFKYSTISEISAEF